MRIRDAQKATAPMAHEQSIIDDWLEDDGVYVRLQERTAAIRRAATAALAVASDAEDSMGSPAFQPLPTLP